MEMRSRTSASLWFWLLPKIFLANTVIQILVFGGWLDDRVINEHSPNTSDPLDYAERACILVEDKSFIFTM
jgi:hypothetical protein